MSVTNATDATAKSRAPWMQFWGDDFMASTLGWSAAERGAYLILLWAAWQGDGLPAESERVFRIDADIRAAWPLLESKFPLGPDGRRRNARQESERAKADKFLRDKASAGRASAAARQQQSNTRSTPVATDQPTETQHEGNHSLSLSLSLSPSQPSETNTLNGCAVEPVSVQAETKQRSKRLGTDADFELWWKVYPRKVGKVAARKAWLKALPAVKQYAQVIDEAVAEVMQEAVAAYVAEPETKKLEPQYVPHPATWLNEGRYIDILERLEAR